MFIKLRVKYSLDGSDSDTYVEKRRYKLELDEWFNVKKLDTGDRIFLMMEINHKSKYLCRN